MISRRSLVSSAAVGAATLAASLSLTAIPTLADNGNGNNNNNNGDGHGNNAKLRRRRERRDDRVARRRDRRRG